MVDEVSKLRCESQSILTKILKAQEDIKKQIIINKHSDLHLRPMSSTVADRTPSPVKKPHFFPKTPQKNSTTPKKLKQQPFQAPEMMKTPKRSILVDRAVHTPGGGGKVKFRLEKSENDRSEIREVDNLRQSASKRPLLGYDWIAGMLDTKVSPVNERSNYNENYLDEITEFRRANRDECSRISQWKDEHFSPTITPHRKIISSPDPTTNDSRIIDYTVNSRLFPVAMDGNSGFVKPGTTTSPRFIRISVPKSVLSTPHKFKAMGSSSSADSMALSDHCMRGREVSVLSSKVIGQPSIRSHLDLRSSLRPSLVQKEF